MEEEIVEEMSKNLSIKERIIVRIFKRTFIKVCRINRINIVNKLMQ